MSGRRKRVQAEPEPVPEEKKVWNSLEVTKLIASAMTALGIFALGYFVTTTSSEEARYREDRAKREANAREEWIRAEGIRRDDLLQDRSRRHAKDARDEAFARAESVRRATEEREARLRAEARAENLQSRALERRIDVWNQIAPRVATLRRNMRIVSIPSGAAGAEARRALETQSESLLEMVTTVDANRTYFSEEFYSAFTEFSRAAEDVLQHSRTPEGPSFQQERGLGRAYSRLLAAARADLALGR